ncbi:MAG: hypothetical protein Q7R81_06980 [Candidatus Peregrinibacteria bacterium]|nr:hypothetical protein [Candidatus Peregrinibacteria bacterium]
MSDYTSAIAAAIPLSDAEQQKVGQAIQGDMGDEYKQFVKMVSDMILSGKIDVRNTETFFNDSVYKALSAEEQAQVDVSTLNVADLLRHIAEFYQSKQTPDACPQLATMIQHLLQMKTRVETKFGDVYKF